LIGNPVCQKLKKHYRLKVTTFYEKAAMISDKEEINLLSAA